MIYNNLSRKKVKSFEEKNKTIVEKFSNTCKNIEKGINETKILTAQFSHGFLTHQYQIKPDLMKNQEMFQLTQYFKEGIKLVLIL